MKSVARQIDVPCERNLDFRCQIVADAARYVCALDAILVRYVMKAELASARELISGPIQSGRFECEGIAYPNELMRKMNHVAATIPIMYPAALRAVAECSANRDRAACRKSRMAATKIN